MIELHLGEPADAGQCVAHHWGRIVFVTGGLPGERVRVEIDDPGAKVLKGTVTEVLEPSEFRVDDRRSAWAENFAALGGVEYAHATDAYGRELKYRAVAEHFRRIAGIDIAAVAVKPIARDPLATGIGAPGVVPSQESWRSRVQFAVDARGRAAGHRARSRELVPLMGLPLASEAIAALDLAALDYSGVDRVEVAGPAAGGGAVLLRAPRPAPEALVAELAERGLSVLEAIGAARPPRRGGPGPRPAGRNRGGAAAATEVRVRSGKLHVWEEPGTGHGFRVRGDGFWQVHTYAPAILTDAVLRAIAPAPGLRVADLYSGAGLLSAALADRGAEVHGIEGSASAVEDARVNVPGATFQAGRVEAGLPEVAAIVLDPPRTGAGRAVTDGIAAGSAERIAYVSCDSATLARDVAALGSHGFALRSLEVFDLFPLTGHVECLAVLAR